MFSRKQILAWGCLFFALAGALALLLRQPAGAGQQERLTPAEQSSRAELGRTDGNGEGVIISQVGADGRVLSQTSGVAAARGRKVHVGFCQMQDYQEMNAQGQRSGYVYELLQLMNFYSDWRFAYDCYDNSWEETLAKLEAGEIDMVAMAEKNAEREAKFLFSDVPVGQQRELLVARHTDSTLEPGRPEQYDGIRVGVIRGTQEGKTFQQYARRHHISFEMVEAKNEREVEDLLLEGEIDALVKGTLTVEPHEKLLVELSSKPIYIMLNKQQLELKYEVDAALRDLGKYYPEWQSGLNESYLGQISTEALNLRRDDREYLKQLKGRHRVFCVAALPDNAPYSYVENGEVRGIIPDIFRLVADKLELEYRFLDIGTRQEYEKAAATADILLSKETQYSLAENEGYKLTRQVLEVPLAEVRRQDAQGEVHRVAVPRRPELLSSLNDIFNVRVEFVSFATVRECIDAVSNGSCDAAYLYFYTAQKWVQAANQDDTVDALQMTVLPDKRLSLSFAVRDSRDYRLGRLLNLGLGTVTKVRVRKLEAQYTKLQPQPQTVAAFLRTHPLVVLLLALGAALAVFAFMRYRLIMNKKSEAKALEASYSDFWTGQHNRHWFESNVAEIADHYRQAQEEHRLAVAVVALNWGAVFQETYGRDTLKECMRQLFDAFAAETDFVRAVGVTTSAQKLYLLLTVPAGEQLEARVAAMLAKNKAPLVNGARFRLELKAGCVYIMQLPFEPSRLTSWAEMALATVRSSIDKVAVFDRTQREQLQQQREIERHMEKGLREKEIKVYCQPKFDISTHSCIGAEALTRWVSPELGFLGPGQFIPIFERNGFALQFDFYMLEETCAMQRRRLDAGQRVVPVSVNQSRLHFSEHDYLKKMRQVAERYQLPAGTIELEITETLFESFNAPGQIKHVIEVMDELHRLGFGMSVDDFGSGYSSLTMLAQLPLDVVKIDRAMLLSAEQGGHHRTVLQSSVELAHALGMRVICEGIETPEQEKMLLELGCHDGQGFIYARPMPMADFEEFLAQAK